MTQDVGRSFEKEIKKRLIDKDWSIENLANAVSDRTGLFCDSSYIFKIWRGERKAPKIVAAIKEILEMEE